MLYHQIVNIVKNNGRNATVDIPDYCIPIDTTTPFLFVSAEETDEFFKTSMHLKYIPSDGQYVPHHESEPSYVSHRETPPSCMFFIDGVNVTIDKLPCDDEMKVYLKLKYTYDEDQTYRGFHVYT